LFFAQNYWQRIFITFPIVCAEEKREREENGKTRGDGKCLALHKNNFRFFGDVEKTEEFSTSLDGCGWKIPHATFPSFSSQENSEDK
jgi:hypothetical protein